MNLFTPGQVKNSTIPGPAGLIELSTQSPEILQHPAVVIICHPNSLQGGSMNNKVVTTIARAMRDLGLRSLRFNFRGVGHSGGVYDAGVGESEDVLFLLEQIKAELGPVPMILAGFSFGSYVAYRAAEQAQPWGLISLAPPVHHHNFASHTRPTEHWLIIMPEADEIVPYHAVADWVSTLDPKPEWVVFAETGHFFHGKLVELKLTLTEHVRAWW